MASKSNAHRSRTRRNGPARAGGFSLLELSAAIGLFGILLVAGYQLLAATQVARPETERRAQIAAAERALSGYTELAGALPCPDTSGDGVQDCAGGAQKGWLPTVTLGLDTSAPARGTARLRYAVYRTAGVDLAAQVDRFNPAMWDGTLRTLGATNGLDFCAALASAALAAPNPNAAGVVAGAGAINVAYAISEPGVDADGNGDLFDGALNSGATSQMTAPAVAAVNGYDDIVVARTFTDVSALMSCPDTVRSVETLSRSVDVAAEVADQKLWAAVLAGVNTGVNAVKTGISALKLGLAVAATVTAAATLAAAITALSAAVASCVVIVGCALIPSMSGAVAAGAAAVAAAAASIVLQGAALAANLTATGISIAVTVKAGLAATPSATNLAASMPGMKTAVDDAAAKATAAETDAAAARASAGTAKTNYDNNVTSLYNTAHGFDRNGNERDPYLNTALADFRSYIEARASYEALKGAAVNKRKEASDATTALSSPAFQLPSDLPQDVRDKLNSGAQLNSIQAEMQATMQANATLLNAEAVAAEGAAAAALTAANTAETKFTTSRDAAVNAYKYSYSTTTDGKTTTTSVDGSSQVRTALNNTTSAYESYLARDRAATEKERAATTARTSASGLLTSYNNISAEINKPPVNGATPAAVQVWSGADAILRAADQTGTVK